MNAAGQYRGIGLCLLDEEGFQELSEGARWTLVALMISLGPTGLERRYAASLTSDLSVRTGASARKVSSNLRELEAAGWIRREGSLFWVVRQLELDPLLAPSNPKHRASIQRRLCSLPRCPLTLAFVARYPAWFPEDPWPSAGTREATDSLSVGQGIPSVSESSEKGGGTTEKGGGKTEKGSARSEERSSSGEGAADAARLSPEDKRQFLKAGFAALARAAKPDSSVEEDEFVRAGRKIDEAKARSQKAEQAAGVIR
jgi:hypothetical protein